MPAYDCLWLPGQPEEAEQQHAQRWKQEGMQQKSWFEPCWIEKCKSNLKLSDQRERYVVVVWCVDSVACVGEWEPAEESVNMSR